MGRGTWCCKQVGGGGHKGVEHQLIWGACEKSRIGEHGVGAGTKRKGGGMLAMGAICEMGGERRLGVGFEREMIWGALFAK